MAFYFWGGTAWLKPGNIHVWNGTAWVPSISSKIWNGSSWVEFLLHFVLNSNDEVYGSGASVSVGYRVDNDGNIYGTLNGVASFKYNWCFPKTIANNYQVRATLTSGNFTTGSSGVWYDISTDPTWTVKAPTPDTIVFGIFNLDIRRTSDLVVVASATGVQVTSEYPL